MGIVHKAFIYYLFLTQDLTFYVKWDFIFLGSFHLIHLMFDDYVLYLLESLHCQERANELMRAMKGEGSPGKIDLIDHDINLYNNTES